MASQIKKGEETNKITLKIESLVNYQSYMNDATLGFVIEPLHYHLAFEPVEWLVKVSASALYKNAKQKEMQCNIEFITILNEFNIDTLCDGPVLVSLHRLEVDTASQNTIFPGPGKNYKKTFIGSGHIDLLDLFFRSNERLQGKMIFHLETDDATVETASSSYQIYANLDLYKNFFSDVGNIFTINTEYISGLPLEQDTVAKMNVCFKLAHPEYFTDPPAAEIDFVDCEITNRNNYLIKGKGLEFSDKEVDSNDFLFYNQTNDHETNSENNEKIIVLNKLKRNFLKYSQCSDLEKYFCQLEKHVIVEVTFNLKNTNERDNMQQFWIGEIDMSSLLYPSVKGGRFKISLLEKVRRNTVKPEHASNVHSFESTTVIRGSKTTISFDKHSIQLESQKDSLNNAAYIIITVSFAIPITERRHKMRLVPHSKHEDSYEQRKSIRINYEFENLLASAIEQIKECLIPETKKRSTIGIPISIDYFSTLDRIKSNLSEVFLKQTCFRSGNKPKTNDNAQFKNLTSLVFNDAVEKLRKVIDAQFSNFNASMNEKSEKNFSERDTKVFVSKECREMGFDYTLRSDCQSEPELIDAIINELNGHNFQQANVYLQELLDMIPQNSLGLIFSIYLLYINEGIEALNYKLIQLSLGRTENFLIWMLIYFIYKSNSYRAGISYAKAMCDNLKDSNMLSANFLKRDELYFVAKDTFRLELKSLYIFLKMGMYKFAEFAYEHCSDQMNKATQIEIFSAILLYQRRYTECWNFITNQAIEEHTATLKNLIEAHCMFHLGRKEHAFQLYKTVCTSKDVPKAMKHIAYLRCGFWDVEQQNFENAIVHFDKCCKALPFSKTFLGWLGLGICYFQMSNFLESQECFSKACRYWPYSYVAWCYLTMINVELNEIETANTCLNISKKLKPNQDDGLWKKIMMVYKKHNIKIPC